MVFARMSSQDLRCIGEASDAIEITSLKVVPDPPEPGKKMTVYAEGSAKQRIDVRFIKREADSRAVRLTICFVGRSIRRYHRQAWPH